ncbi:MAG TPA: hypothetical protein IAB49_03390 [Candidatus Caccenecus avistercoris]|nr:hypothetical protein [Candidatus Caccenecus avistercoris]
MGGFITNTEKVKEEIKKNLNRTVAIKVFGMRGKTSEYTGKINAIYPNIFTILENGSEKSFTYRDVYTGDIKIKYL